MNLIIKLNTGSHETWQLVNSFKCRLPYYILKDVYFD